MIATVVDSVYCSGCLNVMAVENSDLRPKDWTITCVTPHCSKFGRKFKQPIRSIELEEV